MTDGEYVDILNVKLKSVEACDHHKNSWSFLPDLIERRVCHSSIGIGNKMFVVGGIRSYSWEVLDSVSRKFSLIVHGIKFPSFQCLKEGACCNKIVLVYVSNEKQYESIVYDVKSETFATIMFSKVG